MSTNIKTSRKLNPTLHSGGHAPPHQSGDTPSEPRLHRMPSKDAVKALAEAQNNMVHHLSLHACSTLRRMSLVSILTPAHATNPMKRRVSSDQRPATSPADTTNLGRAKGWTNSGQALLAPRSGQKLHHLNQLLLAWAQWVETPMYKLRPKRGKPSTTISSRLSRGSGAAVSKSRTMTLVTTLPPALHMRAPLEQGRGKRRRSWRWSNTQIK